MIVPGAQWRGPVPNRTPGAMQLPSLGLVLHVIEGSLSAADSAFHDPGWRASAHFGVGLDGTLVQWVDTADKAWAEVAGNAVYHSVETEGFHTQALTDAQVATVARLYAWGHAVFGWPFTVVDTPGERGLITHGDGGTDWGGHFDCPGPQRSAQRALIVAGAVPTPTPEDEEMRFLFTHKGGEFIGVFGDWCRPIVTQGQWDYYRRAGVAVNDTDGTAEVQDDIFGQMTQRPPAG